MPHALKIILYEAATAETLAMQLDPSRTPDNYGGRGGNLSDGCHELMTTIHIQTLTSPGDIRVTLAALKEVGVQLP